VENFRTFIVSNHFKLLILLLMGMFCWPFQDVEAQTQISPEGRDRAYKQAAPHRFDNRFDKGLRPKSLVIPIKPKKMEPLFPEDLKGVKFVLKQLLIQGKSIYDKRTFKPLYNKYLNKKLALGDIYEIAQKITNKYRNDGYILSKAIVPPQKIDNGVVYLRIIEGYIDKINVQGPIRGPRKLINQYKKKILKSRPLRAV
ncbi:uncharacterized protein METZ01_LOCUS282894, partial [marine metagenome]